MSIIKSIFRLHISSFLILSEERGGVWLSCEKQFYNQLRLLFCSILIRNNDTLPDNFLVIIELR